MSMLNKHIVNSEGNGQDKNRKTWHALRRTQDGQLWYRKLDAKANKSTISNGSGTLTSDADYLTANIAFLGSPLTYTGDGSTTNFTLTYSMGSLGDLSTVADRLYITIDGTALNPNTDYSVSGTTLTFTNAPFGNSLILVYQINVQYLNNNNDTFQQYRFADVDCFYFIDSNGSLIRRELYRPTIQPVADTFSSYNGAGLINSTTYSSL